jgi:DNA polymerase I-like protein with 3'-5' exonuclease and polymerase domains
MITKYKMLAKRGYITGLDGRWIPVEDPYHTLAAMLQGAEAAIMRRSLLLWTERAKHLDWKLVNWVHDEFCTEVRADHAEELGKLQVQSFVDAGKQFRMKCALDGQYLIGKNWSETH